MKILYVNPSNINGGANIALVNIVRGMIKKGHEVHVLTDNRPGYLLDVLQDLPCIIHQSPFALNIRPFARVKSPLTKLNYYRSASIKWCLQKRNIRRVIKEIQPDIVHTNVGPLTSTVSICNSLNIPHVWHIREYDKHFRMFPSRKRYLELLRSSNNYCIAITKGVFQYHNLRKDIDRQIYDGVFAANQLLNSPVLDKSNYFLFVGRIEPSKGVLDLLKAYSMFINETNLCNYKLLLAGSYDSGSSYFKECERVIANGNVENLIQFLGVRKDVYDLMAHAGCLIVPSDMEGFGFITAEAMLNYCPVIGKDRFGTKEQFDRGLEITGQEVAMRYLTNDELKNCLIRVINESTDEMVRRAHDVLSEYTIENCVNQIETFYNNILSE